MYNNSLKEQFLLNYPQDSAKIYRDALFKISETEEELGKDVFDFTLKELDQCFDNFKGKTLAAIRRLVSPVRQYIDWANSKGYVESKIDLSSLLDDKYLKKYIWEYAYLRSYITRDDLYAFCRQLVNPIDQACIVLPFEGVNGKEHFEMISLKKTDINYFTGEIEVTNIDGEIRTIIIKDQRSLDILKLAEEQIEYIPSNGYNKPRKLRNGEIGKSIEKYYLCNTQYILRNIDVSTRVANIDDMVSPNTITNKANSFFKPTKDKEGNIIYEPYLDDAQFLNIQNIFKSGYFDCCLQMERERGELQTEDYRKACIRYGINPERVYSYKSQYIHWKNKMGDII